ncbi:CoA transferase [Nakamurella sp. YIM 132087]|uniref:CoA transferase n=1 Tax=Nakamurella alba TaxID=2665158 RepID=A0A7K1FNM4_9ACTN|nr:CoA transferase [Nakamurella alba]MTD15761.1 CoA transferase [Nakamurella alba]
MSSSVTQQDPALPEPAVTVPSDGPLAGLRVLDISTILAGPLACQILGDFGADVIKIEHPQRGDGMRGHGPAKDGVQLWWKMVARNKRTVALDLGKPEGAEVFRALAATADVVVENFRPGTLERWGLGYDRLTEQNPGLILLRITGFGQTGPYSARPAFGTLVESMSGFAALTGQPDGPPTLPSFGLADSIAAMAGSSAVLTALYHRDARGGTGQVIDLSLLEPMMTAVGPGVLIADQLGTDQPRTGNRSVNNSPRDVYRTRDDSWVAISTSADTIAARVMHLVGGGALTEEPWFATGRQRAEHADELDAYVVPWIAARDRDEVIAAFAAAGAAAAPIYLPSDLLDDPQVAAREMITTVEDPELGPLRMQNVLWRMSETPGRVRHTGRPIGEDTTSVLAEVGISGEAVEDLRAAGIVR